VDNEEYTDGTAGNNQVQYGTSEEEEEVGDDYPYSPGEKSVVSYKRSSLINNRCCKALGTRQCCQRRWSMKRSAHAPRYKSSSVTTKEGSPQLPSRSTASVDRHQVQYVKSSKTGHHHQRSSGSDKREKGAVRGQALPQCRESRVVSVGAVTGVESRSSTAAEQTVHD